MSLPVHQESREIFMKPGDGVYEAYSFVTVLSVGYLLEGLIPRMKAAIDGDPGVRPQARQFVAYAAPWEPIPDDGLPRFDERLPA